MKYLIDSSNDEAKAHFLKGSSYFNSDLPRYVSFEPILEEVSAILNGSCFRDFQQSSPNNFSNVNYNFISNKDGKLAWRPLELIHPVIYASLVNLICEEHNWKAIVKRFSEFKAGVVDCCSAPVMSISQQTDVATQIRSWWQAVEQRSLEYSLKFTHLMHTDVTDCYGSLYTHSISWALHGIEEAKTHRGRNALLGNKIDDHIQACRYGQTNGMSQGSILMDFIAEIVLGFVDEEICRELNREEDFGILRYRDDYRIFTSSDSRAEAILRVISDKLRAVGMRLGVSKTYSCRNVVEGSVKPDKLAGIEMQDLGDSNAKTIQKQLLRLHSFGQRFPNSGALRRLVGDLHSSVARQAEKPDDLEVQVAIACDIACVSPGTFPAIAGILSHLISLASGEDKASLWSKVMRKMKQVPYNGYLEVWLQRVVQPKSVGIRYDSEEAICKVINGETASLWESNWISSDSLKRALDLRKIVVADVNEEAEVIQPDEVALFKEKAWAY